MRKAIYCFALVFMLTACSLTPNLDQEPLSLISDREYTPDAFTFADVGAITIYAFGDTVPDRQNQWAANASESGLIERIFTSCVLDPAVSARSLTDLYRLSFEYVNNSSVYILVRSENEDTVYAVTFDLLSSDLETSEKVYRCDPESASQLLAGLS